MTLAKAITVWLLSALAASLAVVLVLTSDHETARVATATLGGSVGLAFVTAGLIAWTLRPSNGTGRLMTLVGFAFFLGALAASDDATLFTLGTALSAVVYALFLHFVLAYPGGRLEGRLPRAIVGVTWALVTVGQVATLLVTPSSEFCDAGADCPENRLLVTDSSAASTGIRAVVEALAIAVAAAAIVLLVRRFRAATPPVRRTLLPVYVASGATIVALLLAYVLEWLSQALIDVLAWVAVVGFLSVPLASLYGLLERRLSRAAVSALVVEIGRGGGQDELEESLRRVLHDPTLALVHWDDEAEAFVDSRGHTVAVPGADPARSVTYVEREGRPIAAMLHDPSLLENRGLLDAVSAAAGMAIENDRRFEELRRSDTRTRALLDAIPDIMFRIARDGTYLDFKAETTRDLYDPEVLGRRVQ